MFVFGIMFHEEIELFLLIWTEEILFYKYLMSIQIFTLTNRNDLLSHCSLCL